MRYGLVSLNVSIQRSRLRGETKLWLAKVFILQTVCVVWYRTLCILLIEHSVWMHAVVPARKVLQVNHYDFADFRSYCRP